MEPIITELEKELKGKVEFEKINVDENQDKTASYQVMSIPTYIILKSDKEQERIIGATSKDNLLKVIFKYEWTLPDSHCQSQGEPNLESSFPMDR